MKEDEIERLSSLYLLGLMAADWLGTSL